MIMIQEGTQNLKRGVEYIQLHSLARKLLRFGPYNIQSRMQKFESEYFLPSIGAIFLCFVCIVHDPAGYAKYGC